MEIKQQLRLSQQLVMTPQLQQAIKLLQLSRLELVDEVRKELDDNPVLSEDDPNPRPIEAAENAHQEKNEREFESVQRTDDGLATDKATRRGRTGRSSSRTELYKIAARVRAREAAAPTTCRRSNKISRAQRASANT